MIQEGPKTDKQKLYDALSGEYDLGTYEEFERNIGDSVKRKKLFDAASADYDLGDYESYSQRIGPTHKESLDAFNAEFGSFLNDFEERDTAETKMSRAGMSSGIIVPTEGSITGEERQRYLELHEQEEALKKAWYTSDEYLAQKDAEAFQLAQMRDGINASMQEYAAANPIIGAEAAAFIPVGAATQRTRGEEADKEMAMYGTASRIMEDTINLHNAPSRYDGANAWQNVRKFGKGAGDTLSDVDFWTMGLTEIADNFGVRDVLATVQDKLGNLNNLSEESIENILTPAEKAVLQAWAINAQEQLSRQGDLSRGYQAGQGAAESLGFMAEFMLTGGIGKAAAEGVEQMTKWLAKKTLTSKVVGMADEAAEAVLKNMAEKTASSAVRRYGKNLGLSLAEAAGRTGVMPSTFRNISEKATEIKTDEEGNNYLVGMNNAFASGLADSFIETLSEGGRVGALGELFGDVAGKIPFYKRMVDRLSNSKAGELWDMFQSSGVMNTLRAGGWHGIGEEYLEEWYGNALRTLTGVDKEALKEFATWDNQLITVTSFLPLTIFGGTVSTAQVLSAQRGLDKKAAALRSALIDRGYDEAQADNYIDIMKGASPAEISSILSPIATTVAGRSEMDARALVKPFMDFAMAVRKWQSFDTKYKYQEQEQRDALQQQMEDTLGKFWQEDETGARRVQRAVNAQGEAVYLLGKQSAADAEAGIPASVPAVTADGRKMFVDPSEYQLEDELDMNTFLGLEIMAEKGNTERARMLADQERSIQQIRQMSAPGTQINLGTAEAPIIATVAQRHPDGVIVTTPDGMARQLTYEELGNYLGINATPLTDAQLDEQETDALLAEQSQREAELDQEYGYDEDSAVEIAEAEEEITQSVEAITELPMDSQGNVDEAALWNEDPARWAAWNDEQRRDKGANSVTAITAAMTNLSGQIAEQEAAYAAMPVGTERNDLEKQINANKSRLAQLTSLQQGYAAQAEAALAEAALQAAAQEQAALSASQAQMTEQQLDEMDAQYEGIYSQTRSLNERARLLQEYLDKIAEPGIPAFVLTSRDYDDKMKAAGCSDYAIMQVRDALYQGGTIEGFMVDGKVFLMVEGIPTIDKGRQKYIHEAQHTITPTTDFVARLLATGISRDTLRKYVRALSGGYFYENKSIGVLADEFISFAIEYAYTNTEFSLDLQRLGIDEEAINFIQTIYNEQQGKYFNLAGRRKGRDAHVSSDRPGSSRENDRDLGQVSSGLLGSQRDRSAENSARGAGDREGGEGAAEPAVDNEINPAFVDATSTDAEGAKFSAKLTDSEIDNLVEAMKANAEVAEDLELTPENWEDQFGTDGMVPTPVGNVKMGENQYLKLLQRKRSQYFGMIRPTLVNPDIVLEELSPSENGERDTVLLFIKTFIKPDGSRYVHFESVTIQKDSMEISISSHEIQEEDLKKKMRNDNVAHLRDSLSASEWRLNGRPSDGSDLVPTPSDNLSDSKDSENLETPSDSARFSVITPEMDAEYLAAVERGDMETAQRMVLEAAKLAMPNTKVVDENGNPKVVYHGTGSEFYTFRETSDSNELGAGYYFSDSYEMAERYATDETLADNRFRAEALAFDIFTDEMGHSEEDYDDNEFIDDYNESYTQAVERLFGNGHVKSVFLNLENPRIMSRNSESFDPTYRHGYNHYNEGVMAKRFNDGIIDEMFEERHEGLTGTQYVAFKPSQIKSADPVTYDDAGNVIPLSERFNPEKSDIRFSVLDTTKAELKDKPIKLNGMHRFKVKSAFKGVKGADGSFPYLKAEIIEVSDGYNGPAFTFDGTLQGFAVIYVPKGTISEGQKDNEFFIDPKAIESQLWDILKSAENYYEFKYAKGPYAHGGNWLNAEGNVLFSVSRGSLVGMHNISEEKLRKVIKQGGSANPSTAVIDIERQAFDSYGEISLIMPSSLVDAETGRNAGTFTADAWTPTYPQIEKRFSVDELQRAYWRDITAIPEEMQHEVRMAFDSWLDNRTASGLAYMFLQERGEAPEMVRVAAKFPQEIKDKMSAILGEGRTDFYKLTDEEKQAVLDLYIQENFGGSREDFDRSIAETIQRIEDRLSTGKVPSFVEKRITADLQWMKEHGYNYDNLSDFVRDIVSDIRHAGEVNAAATTNRAIDYIKDNNLSAEYEQWKESLNDRYGIKEYLFDGYTPSGNPRWLPNTVENASKLMNKQGLAGATGMASSFNRFVATLAPKKKSLSDIRSSKERLVEDEKLVDDFRDKWSEVFFDLGIKCQPDAKGYEDYGLERLTEAAQKKNPGAYLKKEYGVELSQEDLQRLADMIKAIKTEFPARYFETKFQRPVYLNEFAAAVIPTTTSADIKQAIAEAGLPIFEYDSSADGARREATLKATDIEGVRFSVFEPHNASMDEIDSLFHDYNGDKSLEPLYDKVSALAHTMGLQIRFDYPWSKAAGSTFGDKVKFNTEFFNSLAYMPQDKAHALLHEMIHAVTQYAIFAKNTKALTPGMKEAVKQLEDVYEEIKTDRLFAGTYGAKSVHEMIAELSNPAFRNLLKVKSLYQRIVDAIKRLLGIEVGDNALDNVSATLDYMIDNYDGTVFNAVVNALGQNESYLRFSVANDNQAIFVSNAARAVEGIKMEKATPAQWLAMIEKNGGLKAGEDKWMGLSDWLKASDKKTFTKQEVLDFIGEHMIRIEEQHYSEGKDSEYEKKREVEEALQSIFDEYVFESEEENDDIFMATHYHYAIEKLIAELGYSEWGAPFVNHNGTVELDIEEEDYDTLNELCDKLGIERFNGTRSIDDTRIQYTTRGLTNKHEIALTVPTIESWKERDYVHFGDAGEGRAVAWIRFGETKTYAKEYADFYDYQSQMQRKYFPDRTISALSDSDIKSLSTEERAEFIRLRDIARSIPMKERTKRRVLVIDEIQSNRHQEGRENGYRDDAKIAELKERESALLDEKVELTKEILHKFGVIHYSEKEGKFDPELQDKAERGQIGSKEQMIRMKQIDAEITLLINEIGKLRKGVPAAPFEKNWHELAMKRMLRYAAEEGYDVIAWTKGEQQAERYNIGGVISEIKATKYPRGYEVVSFGNNGNVVHSEVFADENAMAEVYGIEMSQKIIESVDALEPSETATISGDDLKIGGEGMKGFYDKMLPAFMNKYGKKWGIKVADITLPNVEEAGRVMHSVPVTEEMKASVMEGQVMFSAVQIDPAVRQEMDTIKAKAMWDGTFMKAPNGTETKLTEDQWLMVRTKNFINWFGDWINDPESASKVVDPETREPRVMYHGSAWHPLTEPKGNAVFRMRTGLLGRGAYFASSIEEATLYAEMATDIDVTIEGNYEILQDEYVTDYFLNIRNTEDIRDFGREDIIAVAKSPSQIKSATDTTGEFSERGDIRYSSRFDVDPNPTEAQKKAGNYKMGHLRLDGYNITIENPKGSVRRGTDSKGNEWENTLNNDYGYIRGTEGVDGDHIDVYLSDNPAEGNVFVIDQVNPETREFDEHKVMYGFNSMDEAREAYLANFSEGWNGLGTITGVTKDEFRKWIDSSHRKTKPFSEYKSVKAEGAQSEGYEEVEPRFSVVTDPALLDKLDSEEYITLYRAMQLIDGKLYPPMAGKVAFKEGEEASWGEPTPEHTWLQSDETPWNAVHARYDEDSKDGKHKKGDLKYDKNGDPVWVFKLDKGNGKTLYAAYNPYIHTSASPLNDQFSEAQSRENLVVVRVLVPKSELTSGYKAEKAKDSVGMKPWHKGPISGVLAQYEGKGREVMLTRYAKIDGIVDFSEVADETIRLFEGTGLLEHPLPTNVFMPGLRKELEKRGVQFVETSNKGEIKEGEHKGKTWASVYGKDALGKKTKEPKKAKKAKKANAVRFSSITPEMDAEYLAAVERGDMETAQRMVLEAAKLAMPNTKVVDENGEPMVVYHGTKFGDFYEFKHGKETTNSIASIGYWFSPEERFGERFAAGDWRGTDEGRRTMRVFLNIRNPKVYESESDEQKDAALKSIEDTKTAAKEVFKKHRSMGGTIGLAFIGRVEEEYNTLFYGWKHGAENSDYFYNKLNAEDKAKVDSAVEDFIAAYNQFIEATRSYEDNYRYGDSYEKFKTDIYKEAGMSAEDANAAGIGMMIPNVEDVKTKYVEKLRSEGFDGIVIKQTRYDKGSAGGNNDQYVTFDSSQIKSADPVTYDDAGNVIPLSERFNPEKSDIRFSAISTPTDNVVAEGMKFSIQDFARLAGNIFQDMPESFRKEAIEETFKRGWDMQSAIFQIPARLAEKENWDEADKDLAKVIREKVQEAMDESGVVMSRPLTAKEALWMLYRSTEANGDSILDAAKRSMVADNLGFDKETLALEDEAREAVRFSAMRDATVNAKASMYNRGAVNVWTRLKETFVDMNASVEELVSAIEERSGKKAKGFENILMALNQQSSKGLAAMESYEMQFLNPMFDEIRKIMNETDFTYEDIVRYVILKHGLERNEKLAQRDARSYYQEIYDDIIDKIRSMNAAQKRTYLTNAQLRDADAKAELARLQAVDTSAMSTDEKREHNKAVKKAQTAADEAAEHLERAQKIASMSEKEAEDELQMHFDAIAAQTDSKYNELRENDYSGITSMFYDQLGVNRSDYATEEEYQSALMDAKRHKYDTLADVEAAADMEVKLFEEKVDTKGLWEKINAATKETLRQQYEANMISREQYDNLRGMFEYYVPLRGFKDNTAEDMYTYYRRPNSTGYTKPILAAEGRKTEAESPFGWIASMAGSAIASNVKNEAKLALYYFVSSRPENGIATVSKTWYVHTPGDVDERGKRIFRPAYPTFSEDLSTEEVRERLEQWQEQMRELKKRGLAYESGQKLNLGNAVVNISDANKPEHIVNVKVAGKDYTIIINGNPRAAQAINGDLNIEATAQDYSAVFGPILRWMSSVNTSYNPEFWITNMMRDMAFTWMAVNTKESPEYRRKFGENYRKAFSVIRMVAKNEKGTLGDSYLEKMYKEFVEYGGVTGYTQIKDNETWEKEIEKYLSSNDPKSIRSGKVMKGVKTVFHAAHRFGESLEQVSRFAAFLTSREMGKSMAEAVNDAKEITVNFNRKGSGKVISLEEAKHLTDRNGKPLSKFWQWVAVAASSISPLGRRFIMFFNAAIQGLNATYKLYKANPKRMVGWTLAYASLGMMNAVLHAFMDDDDDYLDIPQYERRNSLMIGGGGVYLKWALPQEARAFYALGDIAVESIMGRNPHQNAAGEIGKVFAELLPINPAEGWKAFLPSIAVPAFELLLNEDYKGDPIYNEMKWLTKEERERTAKWSNAKKGTGKTWVLISQGLNNVTGGDMYDAGLINIQPEKMEHLVQSAFGGTIRTADKFITTVIAMIDPEEEWTARQTPFLNRILTINDERFRNVHVNDVFDFYRAEAEHAISLEKKYTKAKDSKALRELRSSDEYKWAKIYTRHRKALENINDKVREAEGTRERKELMKQQDELKKKMIKEFSSAR